MKRVTKPVMGLFLIVLFGLWVFYVPGALAGDVEQQPTGDIPTVTGTASGPIVTVNSDQPQINVRSGPGTNYPEVGILVAGQRVPAVGRTEGGLWIQIVYPGVEGGTAWIYSPLVSVPSSSIPIVEVPPTPTPRTTPTVDPTLAAQFDLESTPTRLPTYTPPGALSIPTYENPEQGALGAGLPMGMVILALAVIGVLGMFVSLIRGRS